MFDETELLTPEIVAAAHDAGYVIWVWPNDRALENATAYAELLARGVDGLNINDPGGRRRRRRSVRSAHGEPPTDG